MDLLKSKKFQVAVAGVIVAALGKLGLDMDEETILLVLSPIIAYILGKGVADIGKEQAKIEEPAKAVIAEKKP